MSKLKSYYNEDTISNTLNDILVPKLYNVLYKAWEKRNGNNIETRILFFKQVNKIVCPLLTVNPRECKDILFFLSFHFPQIEVTNQGVKFIEVEE